MKITEANEFGTLKAGRFSEFKSRYGISLPPDYEEFLLKCNGGEPGPSDFKIGDDNASGVHGPFYGIHRGPKSFRLDANLEVMAERVPPTMVPIASDVFGKQICIAESGPLDPPFRSHWIHPSGGIDHRIPLALDPVWGIFPEQWIQWCGSP